MSDARPNILLVTTDQQRYDTTGPRAPSFMRTPHFDHICREGITFERAYADCPVCAPARVGIMSGQTVFTHGMDTNGETSDVLGRDATLPALLGCGAMALGMIGLAQLDLRLLDSRLVRLITNIVAGAAIYAAFMAVFFRADIMELVNQLRRR